MKLNTWRLGACLTALALLPGAARAALFSENFNDGLAASRWSAASQTEATAQPTTLPDGSVNFAFDYSSLGIPSANGGDTVGAFIQVNNTDQAGDEGESYVIFPTGQSYASPFVLEADMYVYNDGSGGTTELGLVGAYLNNADPIAPYQWGSRGGPLAWGYVGEGGSTADLAAFTEGNASSTGYAALSDYDDVPAGNISGFETGVSGSGGPAGLNASGSWVKVRIEAAGSTVKWFLNGSLVDTYDNSGGFYTAGNVFLGASDPFNSVNAAGGTVVDNVTVTVPEPAAACLVCCGVVLALAAGRRR
ncbi:MAG: hypothetical protein IT424_01565 [Pirellulales bacterium]|nr:hypothetical protein [Pirellulales bacterium]